MEIFGVTYLRLFYYKVESYRNMPFDMKNSVDDLFKQYGIKDNVWLIENKKIKFKKG